MTNNNINKINKISEILWNNLNKHKVKTPWHNKEELADDKKLLFKIIRDFVNSYVKYGPFTSAINMENYCMSTAYLTIQAARFLGINTNSYTRPWAKIKKLEKEILKVVKFFY